MISTIKNIGGWPERLQDNAFKSTKTSDISNAMVKIVPLDNSWVREKKNFWKSYVLSWKRVCFQYFYWCKGIVLKEIIWKDTEINVCKVVKVAQIFEPATKLKGL